MIGAFHQPAAVLIHTATLETLEQRQFKAGLAEVVKYGIIGDADFFLWLEQHFDRLLDLDPATLSECIHRCCSNKATIVQADEREVGKRALLNLGHTFGHAIETATGYGNWLHGEAVGLGIRIAAALAHHLALLDATSMNRIDALLQRAGAPEQLPAELLPERMLELMGLDKKNLNGQIRYILPTAIGAAVMTEAVPEEAVIEILEKFRRRANSEA